MKGFVRVQRDTFETKAIFEIKLENHNDVYMSVPRTNGLNDERFIVVVDAIKFLDLWRAEPYNCNAELSHGTPESWIHDRKYHFAAKGFSHGYKNPVPIANIVCQEHDSRSFHYKRKYLIFKELDYIENTTIHFLDFNNGITRTIWLLTHGAKYFPVECHRKEGIKLLAENAAYEGSKFISVEELTNDTNPYAA